jgi:acyl dehydratase
MPGELFLDDLHVGQKFAAGPVSVTADDIIRFAGEYDPQPFHLDPEAAKKTIFKGLVASGWHIAALTMRMLTNGGFPISTGIIGVGGEIAWPTPCALGMNSVSRAKSSISSRRARCRTGRW